MSLLSVVILSNTLDEEIYNMNAHCISSLFDSEDWDMIGGLEILLIESNNQNSFIYDSRVNVLVPDERFNFHRFLNLGIEMSEGNYVALCNNDIIFSKKWFTEILKIKDQNKRYLCFSPIDRDYKTMSYDLFPEHKDYYVGWNNKYHFAAWCFVLDRSIFKIIDKLDETFNFYSADDDFLMTLRKYALENVLVTHSYVKHLSQVVTKKENEFNDHRVTDTHKYPLTEKELKRGLAWLWDDIRFYDAHFKMEAKWGNERMIRRINRLLDKYPFLRMRLITKMFYNKKVNLLLTKLTGI